MKKKRPIAKVFLSLYHYVCFFLLMAFVITCCMLLFLNTMSKTPEFRMTEENLHVAATLTFWNVVFLSFVYTMIDALRRKIMVERPVKRILDAAEQITRGDYSVRIPPLHSLNRADGLDEIIECFNKMAEELSGTETLRTDFIANVSHELKTPLSVMQNYATLLRESDLPKEERMYYAGVISDASQRLAGLVTNILKLNKLENQQIYPAVQTYQLSEQICECLLAFESIWEKKQMELETEIQEEVFVKADPELLSLVWNNLFSNAFKFTGPGGMVRVQLKEEHGQISVKVSDTGCGIRPEVGHHIFEKFYQGDRSHGTQGNGLGLALVKRVVDIMHGDISVESEVGKGTVFTVTLPMDQG